MWEGHEIVIHVVHNNFYDEQKSRAFQLRFRCFFFFITFANLSAFFELFLTALCAARFALRASNNVDNDTPIVLPAREAGSV